MTTGRLAASGDLVRRYLPEHFYERIPPASREWRGRVVLMLWALGYPLEMAWSFGMTDDGDQVRFYKEALAELEDERLIHQLDSTDSIRGDGSHLEFMSFAGEDDEKDFWVLVRLDQPA